MKIKVLKTNDYYNELVTMKENLRESYFVNMCLTPFDEMYHQMHMPKSLNGFKALKGLDEDIQSSVHLMENYDVWQDVEKKLYDAIKLFEDFKLPDELTVGILLGDEQMLSQSGGYTGIGSIPGYIQLIIAPDDYNIPRLSSCAIHELHHNILFANTDWSFADVSVSQYLAVEGLAESLVNELYGYDYVGPWVSDVDEASLQEGKAIVGDNLDVSGFMNVRKYIFGDHPMLNDDEKTGLCYCCGYALGYHAVQMYMKKHHKTVIEATKDFITGQDIIKLSSYF